MFIAYLDYDHPFILLYTHLRAFIDFMHKIHYIPSLLMRLSISCFLTVPLLIAAGCSSDSVASNSVVNVLSPYRMEIVQGNFVSQEQADLIQPGMSRSQVRTILGTPLLTDIFHTDRWDYIFTINRKDVEPIQRRFTVFFNEDIVTSIEVPAPLLSEEEFVQHLDANRPNEEIKVPDLEATPQQLEAAASSAQAFREQEAQQAQSQSDVARPSSYYPPLDPN